MHCRTLGVIMTFRSEKGTEMSVLRCDALHLQTLIHANICESFIWGKNKIRKKKDCFKDTYKLSSLPSWWNWDIPNWTLQRKTHIVESQSAVLFCVLFPWNSETQELNMVLKLKWTWKYIFLIIIIIFCSTFEFSC